MKKAKSFVNIDHHVSNTKFAAVNVVDEQAASSAEIVLQLLSRMGADITEDIATCLYVGLVTDTGRFGYASAKPRTHAAAAFLIQRGVDVAKINQALYESYPFRYLKVLGRALEHATVESEPDFVLTYLLQSDLSEFGLKMDDTDDVIDTVRVARETDVTVLLKELEDGTFKGSFRSKGATDVSALATSLGGGGHKLAAGFEVAGPLSAAIDTVRKALSDGS
jgi:phosphoesterase RecJ-like protein